MPQENPMDDQANVFATLTELIPQIASLEVAPEMLTRDTSLTSDLMLDSISLLSLMALLEERLGVSFAAHTQQVANLDTLGDAADLVEMLMTVKA
ncbi:acyl carrier protein [Burkholderia glumae]|nr:acyl carrier protein [Burkholderia glumae]RQZ75144.1 acyl carrier protein [Burkholderia glumae]UVS84961.1 acyl carrier protein [Burkholderia glumae]UVS95473.1 acyl carrier protein [Burkholderia glumae]